MLLDKEKLSVVFDRSNDQPEKFPNGYYIVCILEWYGNDKYGYDWVNTGYVYHVAELRELDNILKERYETLTTREE